ncbi:hypothetical protein PFISCL1PPCAC_11910, partial [Pristionchus fissidentatus]
MSIARCATRGQGVPQILPRHRSRCFISIRIHLQRLFLFLQWSVWRKAGSGHRKRYALILFRSVTSLLTLFCLYILLIVSQGGGL